ncbi:arabinan endo-1,5-alpha-L-arabinosidase [Marinoscillum sp. MHG1-6]|uniref:arabinan endo-1,5-alpha-L-arabinosidase n=1 Tax=Marinoscillum sp. MHG1-6 TaxID=2959627 RepID=UPI002157FFF7|nr:arabinan endo-1,5-alpha-L-arabinosidase [Marinoscillum sp. MHG1-6]
MRSRVRANIYLVVLLLSVFGKLVAQDKDIRVHDPVMIEENGTYYLFCTGNGISVFSSYDMVEWKREESVFDEPPAWTDSVVPGFKGHIWAPDISYYNGKYYLYYSVSAFGKNTSAIGLVTNKTLNAYDPSYKWEDQGVVVESIPGRDLWNAIDPNLVEDEKGSPWLVFGSFWEGMKMFQLSSDRTAPKEPQQWITVAKRARTDFIDDSKPGDAAIEAPFIFKKDGSYYLFVSWDYCCRGKESTYKVVVGKSNNVTGPYMDKEGKRMDQGGGTLVVQGDDRWAGVGHNSAYTFNDKDYLVFHGYDLNSNGAPKLMIREISWTIDGWPQVELEVAEQ